MRIVVITNERKEKGRNIKKQNGTAEREGKWYMKKRPLYQWKNQLYRKESKGRKQKKGNGRRENAIHSN
jgi:hypothetical protein